jgi:hypothetical protein
VRALVWGRRGWPVLPYIPCVARMAEALVQGEPFSWSTTVRAVEPHRRLALTNDPVAAHRPGAGPWPSLSRSAVAQVGPGRVDRRPSYAAVLPAVHELEWVGEALASRGRPVQGFVIAGEDKLFLTAELGGTLSGLRATRSPGS